MSQPPTWAPTRADRPAAILIAGPTASGKSALATALAIRHGGVVVNADSMQVYADLRVLSARPTPEEEARAPHRLYGTVDAAVNFSAGHYARAVAALLEGLDGRLPVFVGGTGLYFRALEEGLSDLPTVPEAVRAEIRAFCEARETPALHAALAERDPQSAGTLRPSDRARVMRALEIHAATGRSILAFHGTRVPGPLAGRPLRKIFLAPEREALRARIDARFLAMMQAGALDEAQALRERRLDPMLPVMRAHGVPGLIAHLDGRISREEAVARGQGDTRRYAKRQLTWFRHQMGDAWQWQSPEAAMAAALAD
ncbi:MULTISPECIES: tRNA (adenosine(37)-N6)-dimethylallyltransferase MiaA [Methylobacterium]|uniref:tRNA dimethylallyltransferase n=1 Tax=Methylobacterium jeotgali TaxID=381630 RepID=A0ABQ4SVT4_9HYPH|nr:MULTISPECIES: tRNA (adenosine(37)-N6)-dimethylallyltransferase MiaA [Methylobacterium]PIU04417.1 MAG: tRNA (adenosine(37)-N6)-dimethylallyltransferase MiaA [Methylobacterium sp. CG09_land_8_20_14_0_10_71_15]PIU11241.1 MAG: tRNA (adenosine(37)-N6)-dimethylallyltransferase MiaA [Methylobacterium sp. CG08_land_8_20_14_0_20_71_15]GBU18144.1 delta(2)-isopentenylpyrophosphate tRNA-adenosine transferase [Methylobacterium sp.]GJE06997.1 tRNA dimethylallyltransferase [Methylobacterium jeotgali]